jgi:hypothetical protein
VLNDWANSSFVRQFNKVLNDLAAPATIDQLVAQTRTNMMAGACPGGIMNVVGQFDRWYLEGDTSSSFRITSYKELPTLDYISVSQVYMVRMWELHQRLKLEGRGVDAFPTSGGGHDYTWFYNQWTAFGVAPHVSMNSQHIYPYDSEIKQKLASTAWYQLQLTLNPGDKSSFPGGPVDWNYQSPHIMNMSNLTGHTQGLRLLYNEIVGMQQAAGVNAWEYCNDGSKGRFYYAPKNHNPSRAIFEPALVCVGEDYTSLDPGVWRDIATLMTQAFVDQITERSPGQFPRKDTASNTTVESASYVPAFDATRPLCGVDDVAVGGNIYRSLKVMRNIGVDPQVIQSLAGWGKAMWPLGNWDYWKE